MMGGRPLWSLSGSLLLHGLALAAVVALVSREPSPPILVVELEEAVRVGEAGPPAAAPRGDPRPAAMLRGPRGPVRSSVPVAVRPLAPEPPTDAEPLAGPSVQATAELPAPASAWIPGPVSEPSADVPRHAAGSSSGGAGVVQESGTGGIPGAGPLAMLAPSAGAGVTAAGPGGGDGGVPAEFGPYLAAFRQRIQESLNYPLAARRRGLGGVVQLEVELLPSGKVASVVVRSSSSHAVLDEAALETVGRLQPGPFPPGVPPRPLKVRVPIVFELK